MACFPIRPFWNDEWRLLYNIKFKPYDLLWGRLDLLQECPRLYLFCIKKISSFFDYSYTSLRMPALVLTAISICFCFYLKNKIFPNNKIFSFLFILILISSQTFTDYMVQVKHYEMEILLCLLAFWQLITLLEMCEQGKPCNKYKYFLLCISFFMSPYFGYTYSIAVAPVFPLLIFSSLISINKKEFIYDKKLFLLALYLPLVIAAINIVIFYFIDVKQVMGDNKMYWSYMRMLGNKKGENHFIEYFWNLFSLVGSGFLYEIIFGIIGVLSFFYVIYKLAQTKINQYTKEDYYKLYGILLLVITLCLFLSGKLLGSVARLTAYTIPSIAFIIISFLQYINIIYTKLVNVITVILFVGLFGNIITTCINTFTYPEYSNRIKTLWNTSLALKQARLNKIPIFITDGVCGDIIEMKTQIAGKITYNTIDSEQIKGADKVCSEVIVKINPEYKVWDNTPIYIIPDIKWTNIYINQLPIEIKSAIVCDGINYFRINR